MHTFNDTINPESYVDGRLNGRFSASILFIDISQFTPLTETLFQYQHQGAEILSALLGELFGEMVSQVYARQGFIPMFAGDGFFAVFPGSPEETAERAWQTAVSIQKHFRSARGPFSIYVTPYGNFQMGVKIGMAVGEIEWGIFYSDHQAICYFRGDALYDCSDAEQTAVTGEIIAHDTLLAYLNSAHEAWSADVPNFNKVMPVAPVPSPSTRMTLALPPVLAAYLRNQGNSVAVSPNFRQICPVFVSFQEGHPEWPIFVKQAMHLAAQYGGTFSRLEFGDKGDMMILWFGAPISHENNVERAAKFLLALERETAVPWRAGLTYGLVWSGNRGGAAHMEYGVVGDALNTAARIVEHANWGQIWLDESVARELHVAYGLQALGEFKFKGKQKAQPLFRLTGLAPSTDILPVSGIVGRKDELNHCHDALQPIFNGRFAHVITVQGEAGIGKSRFASALRQQLGDQVTWLTCPADDILSESLNLFQTMLAAWANQSLEHEASENWKKFLDQFNKLGAALNAVDDGRVAGIYAELRRTQTALAHLTGISLGSAQEFLAPELRFNNSLLALTAFLQAQALIRPLVLHVEDAHWLDDESWQFLTDLPRRMVDFPIAVFMTGRPNAPFSRQLQPQTAVLHARIALQPFTKSEIQDLCRLLLGKPVTDELLDFLWMQSEGNPFFTEQLILELSQQGTFILEGEGETAVFALAGVDQQILPQTLNSLLTARLDRLSGPVKTLVQTAAVLGQRFTLPLLAAMCPQDAQLLDNIQAAAAQQIWRVHTDSSVYFQHALLRDVAYTMQPQSQRCVIHHQAATVLETLHIDDPADFYREIAHHYHAAYENGMLSARKPARRYLYLAGEQAAKMYENETAVTYFSTALNLTVRDAKKFPLLLAREAVYHLQGKRDLQSQDIQQLTRIAKKFRDKELIGTAALRQARYAEALGDYVQSVDSVQVALANANTQIQAAAACLQWGLVLVSKGAYQEAIRQLFEALLLAGQTKERTIQSNALVNLGKISFRQGDYQTSISHYHRALIICRETGNRQMEGAVLNDLGEVSRFQNDFETAVANLNAALAIAQEIGDRRTESRVLKNLGNIAGSRYHFVEARDSFFRDLQISKEIGDLDGEGQALGNLGTIEVLLGNYMHAADYIQQNLSIARSMGNRHGEVEALALSGWCDNSRGNWVDALSYFELGLEIAREIGDQELEMYSLGGLGLALTGLNRPEEGAQRLRQAVAGFRNLQIEAYALESLAGWIRAQLASGNVAETKLAIEELLDYLYTVGPYDGADTPLLILWTLYQALSADEDDRAQDVWERMVALLKTAVSHIPDEPTRQSFLENVSWHQKIILADSEQVFYN